MSIDDLARLIAEPAIEFRPELRWWLAEGLHTDETLRYEIDAAYRLGFGGMEFLAMDEAAIDHNRYGWGAEEWVHDSQIVVEETTKRNMSVSFTSGTNWSNANLPTIDPEHPAAAKELNVTIEHLAGGTARSGALPRVDLTTAQVESVVPGHRGEVRVQSLVAVIAARVNGPTESGAVLEVDSVVDLTARVTDESLDWTAPAGDEWRLFTFWMHGTGQTASPSASINYTVNYLDRDGVDAVIDYWDSVVLTPELRAQIAETRAQMYMDSLELSTYGAGGLFWGRTVADEFRTRRGYDIAPWLPFLTRTVTMMAATTSYHNEPDEAHRTTVEKVRFDYVRTLTDLYIENMLRPFADFLHAQGILLRSEISYGLPFELTRPGPEVDGIETESLEFGAQIDAYRLLAGPAHLFGKQYSSVVRLWLSPGETALITLDRSAGAGAPSEPATDAPVAEIPTWDIAVESWDAGELQLITEDRGLGYVTREVRPTTAVTRIDAGTGELRPWLSLVGPEVSGVGDYRSTVRLDERGGGRLLLDLGSTAGGLGSVSVNGAAARGFDTSRPIVDVTDDVRAGDNTIHVRVSSSLNNRLLARGYYDRVPDIMLEQFGREGTQQTEPHPHGLLGPVRLLREA